jgi:pimeloyl-ACP methyl ester carboxylesterase
VAYFTHDGRRLAYTVYGDGPRAVVLLPGMLLSQRMHVPLARTLADRGNRVVTLDLLGHGKSDRPRDMRAYSMPQFAGQTLALLDHLEIEQAVVGGTSLGANVTLCVASVAPQRVRAMLLEMPVLDNALLGCVIAFTPLLVALTFGERVMRMVQAAARAVPSDGMPFLADVGLDTLRQDPGPSASVVQGVLFGSVAPPASERRRLEAPALVIGHRRDPIHPFSDADGLARELPRGELLNANSIIELRLSPDRLTAEIAGFVERCWKPRARRSRRSPATGASPDARSPAGGRRAAARRGGARRA